MEQLDVEARACGEGAWKIDVMVGVAEPLERCEEGFAGELGSGAVKDFLQQQAVGEDGQVMAVLFNSGDWDDDRQISGESVDLFPGEFVEEHSVWGQDVSLKRRYWGAWRVNFWMRLPMMSPR